MKHESEMVAILPARPRQNDRRFSQRNEVTIRYRRQTFPSYIGYIIYSWKIIIQALMSDSNSVEIDIVKKILAFNPILIVLNKIYIF